MIVNFYGKSMYNAQRHFGIERKRVELPKHIDNEKNAYEWLIRNGFTRIQRHDFDVTR